MAWSWRVALYRKQSDHVTPPSLPHAFPRENGSPRQDVILENPTRYYSAVKKDKHSLRKKVVRDAIHAVGWFMSVIPMCAPRSDL